MDSHRKGDLTEAIVLRVDEPKKQDSRINWAEEYVFPENVPWD